VWCWKITDDDGESLPDDQGLLPELAKINWTDKEVVLLYDSDIVLGHTAYPAFKRLADQLYRLGGESIKILSLPSVADGQKTGIDDFIIARGDQAIPELLTMADNAVPYRQKATNSDDGREYSPLEEALLYLNEACDGAAKSDGHGFNKKDTEYGKAMATKVLSGQDLSPNEYNAVYRMLKKYNKNQLKSAGLDWDQIPKPTAMLNDNDLPIRIVTTEDPVFTVGICSDTGAVKQVSVIEATGDQPERKYLSWISDCAVYIDTETNAIGITEFVFRGRGAVDSRDVCFTMKASDVVDSRKFKSALLNAFGARNRVGELKIDHVQRMSENVKLKIRVEVPVWKDNIPLVPGLDLLDDVEFDLSSYTPAFVYDGNIDEAKECLRKLLSVHKYSPIVVTGMLGSPAVARWHPNDRFGVGLWGLTGSLKTTFSQTAMTMYGIGYLEDAVLLKHGKAGSTLVSQNEVFASAGILPQILENIKTVDPKDAEQYVATMHAVIEGAEKARGKKEGGLRESREFYCTPIPNGEVKPSEASTTARVLNLNWTRPDDNGLEALTHVQQNVATMPIIGYHFLRFLAETELNLVEGFHEARQTKMAEFIPKHFTNPGRLATIDALLRLVWKLLKESPFGDVFKEFDAAFATALDEVVHEQGAMVTDETEVQRFIRGIQELLASRSWEYFGFRYDDPDEIPADKPNDKTSRYHQGIIGKIDTEGLFLLPDLTLNELTRMGIFTQRPSIISMTNALYEAKYLKIDPDGKHKQYQMRWNKQKLRGWMLINYNDN
ncbi:MAG: DUF3854 domain-containing protein, partial [Methanotrichaceae archaeon]|nr:DUF3854 domain-containing protein [Methanotrichaceae archaeon]